MPKLTPRKIHRAGLLGKLLAHLPNTCPLLYPLYEAAQLEMRKDTILSVRLPPEMDGLRIVYVSDIHYGAYLNEKRVRSLSERVNAQNADIVVLGGDYGEDCRGALAFFALKPGFRARLCVAGVVGNHDRSKEGSLDSLTLAMRKNGVTPLVNDACLLPYNGRKLALCGIDDLYNGIPEIKRAAGKTADADFVIYLPHTPDALPLSYFALSDTPWFHLALCGHTHGGQVVFGRFTPHSSSIYGNRYRSGRYSENGVDILVSNGVGTSGLPVRLGARAQFNLITLRSSKGAAR